MAKQEKSVSFKASKYRFENGTDVATSTQTPGLSAASGLQDTLRMSNQTRSYTLLKQLSAGIETPITNTVTEVIKLVLLRHTRNAHIPMHAKISLAASEIMELYKGLPKLQSKMRLSPRNVGNADKLAVNGGSNSLATQPTTLNEKLQLVEEAFSILCVDNGPIRTDANESLINTDTSTASSDDSVITVINQNLIKNTVKENGSLSEMKSDFSKDATDNNGKSTNEKGEDDFKHRGSISIITRLENCLSKTKNENFTANTSETNTAIKTNILEVKPKRKRKINMAAKLGAAYEEAKRLAMYCPSEEETRCINGHRSLTCPSKNHQKTAEKFTKQNGTMSHVTKTGGNQTDTTEYASENKRSKKTNAKRRYRRKVYTRTRLEPELEEAMKRAWYIPRKDRIEEGVKSNKNEL